MKIRPRLLIGSLLVAVLAIAGFVVYKATSSDDTGHADDAVAVDRSTPLDQQPLNTNAKVTGSKLADAYVRTEAGDEVATSALLGQPLVVNYWSSTCAPCKKELPDFVTAHDELGEQVRFIGIDSFNSLPSEVQFAKDRGVDYELFYDGDGSFSTARRSDQPTGHAVRSSGRHDHEADRRDRPRRDPLLGRRAGRMIALDARNTVAFTTGLLAAVNPCGFVLLPTYLLYFLGMENLRPGGTERASLRRALLVSLAVSAGFLAVFAVIGVITKWSTDWFVVKAPWISLAIGLAMVVLGIAMLFGFHLPFTTPKLNAGGRDRTVPSMFVFGIAYAIASVGCTIPTFMANVLGAVTANGVWRGVVAFLWYSLGMALIVTGLTVTLAMANVAMLRVLRRSLSVFEYIAGVFVLLTGLYLSWYWYNDISKPIVDDRVINRATSWQESLRGFIERNQTAIVTLAVVVIGVAIVLAYALRRRPETPA